MADPISATSAHTLQAMIELVYVKAANDIIYSNMTSLNSSLQVNKAVLDGLARLQTLHNAVKAQGKSAFDFDFAVNHNNQDYTKQYQSAASAFFNTPIQVVTDFSDYGNSERIWGDQVGSTYLYLKSALQLLSAITPSTNNPATLYQRVKTILSDLESADIENIGDSTVGPIAHKHLRNIWLLDSYNVTAAASAVNAGNYQQNITNAITACQSLNTTQTEKVQSYLYLFQEYYKSATAMLSSITQIIQHMAQNAA